LIIILTSSYLEKRRVEKMTPACSKIAVGEDHPAEIRNWLLMARRREKARVIAVQTGGCLSDTLFT